jgi:hypothetical protein
MTVSSRIALLAVPTLALMLAACGGSEPAPKDASLHDAPPKTDNGPGIVASAEIGGMNEEAVDAAFTSSVKGLQRCLDSGAKRIEFLGGSVSFFLKIDATGKVANAYLEHSTLGNRTTERCMLDSLTAKSWPKPVGGEHGLARKSFTFDPPNDVREPITWDDHDAAPGLKKIADDVGKCKQGHAGRFEATLYVDTTGKVLSAGATPPDQDGDAAVDCLVGVLESATFPSPGSWPAKVTLEL